MIDGNYILIIKAENQKRQDFLLTGFASGEIFRSDVSRNVTTEGFSVK